MQKGIIGGIIILLMAAGGFLLWRAQTAEMPGDATMQEEVDMETDTPTDDSSGFGLTDAPDVVFDLSGSNFQFSQKELRVTQGDIVRINFTSESGSHTFNLDRFNVEISELQAGESASVTFVAEEVGTFEYYCSVGMHRDMGMVGSLIVEPAATIEATAGEPGMESGTEIEVDTTLE